jgi:hypothetical protein
MTNVHGWSDTTNPSDVKLGQPKGTSTRNPLPLDLFMLRYVKKVYTTYTIPHALFHQCCTICPICPICPICSICLAARSHMAQVWLCRQCCLQSLVSMRSVLPRRCQKVSTKPS